MYQKSGMNGIKKTKVNGQTKQKTAE